MKMVGPLEAYGLPFFPAWETPRTNGNVKETEAPGSKACPAEATSSMKCRSENMPSFQVLARRQAKSEKLWRKEKNKHKGWNPLPMRKPLLTERSATDL